MPDSADQLPSVFFVNPRCPPTPSSVEAEAEAVEADLGGAAEDLEGDVVAKE